MSRRLELRDEWKQSKPGNEWVYDAIDEDHDRRFSPDEYREFQALKQKHQDWKERLKAKVSGK